MTTRDKTPALRCKDCGALVYLDNECSICECGAVWKRTWSFDGKAQIELWQFYSIDKPGRRRKNGAEK